MNSSPRAAMSLKAENLRCEYLINPLGIDARAPRLSWIVDSEQPGQKQSAYRIAAATSEAALRTGTPDLWDSGTVRSSDTAHVPYAGAELASRQRCYWRVQVWDKDGNAAGVSDIGWFEMGLLAPDNWKAHWINGRNFEPLTRAPRSARRNDARGPARNWLKSRTVISLNLTFAL